MTGIPKHEEVDAHRRAHVRGLVHAIDDTGGDQVLQLETHPGAVRSQVPVHQPFGFASHAPADGAVTIVHAMGGDGGDPVAMPPANPQAARFGNLAEGESVLYDASGQRLHFRNGTLCEVQALSEFRVLVAGATVLDLTAAGVTITGTLTVQGAIKASEDVVAGNVSLQKHDHTGVQPGSGTSGPPVS